MRNLFLTVYYWVNVKTWVHLLILLAIKRDIQGLQHIPRKGALILASNHLNVGDPSVLTGITPRRIAWMTKQELFDIPVFGILYHLFGCIPVRRFQADLRALRQSQEALRRGLVLGMFPEGTRSGESGLGRGEPGAALVAMRTNTPILPVAIWGTEGIKLPRDFFRRTEVHIRYGKPFYLPESGRLTKEAVEEGAAIIMRRIAELLPQRYRGIYADTEPRAIATKRATQ
ncbi:MAG: 1-acyl-sn-glycerol-3-phosphate acyltransferase [Chloroflexi bacterium]|nr:1-acyl-sn-glycerol-3-phosphate acyltransferase [Chloroflexota bacterium]